MKLLVASSYSETTDALQDQLNLSDIKADLIYVETVDDLVNELKKDLISKDSPPMRKALPVTSFRQGLPESKLQGCDPSKPSLASGFRQSLPE
jgi:hypothetical protein